VITLAQVIIMVELSAMAAMSSGKLKMIKRKTFLELPKISTPK